MASVDLMVFMDDMLHISRTSNTLTASSTATGYAIDNAREADLVKAWKPNNGVGDSWLEFDPATDSDVGTLGQAVYGCFAYDARNSNCTTIKWQVYDGSWGDAVVHSVNTAEVGCVQGTFNMGVTPYQKYRLLMTVAAGGVPAKIFSFAMFNQSDVIRMNPDYTDNSEAQYQIGPVYRVGVATTAGGHRLVNEYAKPGQRFTVSFQPASWSLFDRFVNDLFANGGPKRAVYVYKSALRNLSVGTTNFFLCNPVDMEWAASVDYREQYKFTLTFETCPWL